MMQKADRNILGKTLVYRFFLSVPEGSSSLATLKDGSFCDHREIIRDYAELFSMAP